MIFVIIISIFFIVCAFSYKILVEKHTLKKIVSNNDHVLITGGSSGIGFSIAKEVLSKGAKVTLFARNYSKLENAKEELVSLTNNKNLSIQSVDVKLGKKRLNDAVELSEKNQGDITMLVNCAGYAIAKEFDELTEDEAEQMFNVNFFGSFYLTQIVAKNMKDKKIEGHILFVSSLAALFGFYGFSVYAPCKAAVLKAAEAIHMELKPYNITVTVGLPPDTDTPGFIEEQKGKPVECKLISEGGGLYHPDTIARKFLIDCKLGKFYSTVGVVGLLLTTLCSNMTPIVSAVDLLKEILLCGLCRLIAAICLFSYDKIVSNEHKKKLAMKKEN